MTLERTAITTMVKQAHDSAFFPFKNLQNDSHFFLHWLVGKSWILHTPLYCWQNNAKACTTCSRGSCEPHMASNILHQWKRLYGFSCKGLYTELVLEKTSQIYQLCVLDVVVDPAAPQHFTYSWKFELEAFWGFWVVLAVKSAGVYSWFWLCAGCC